MNGADNDWWRRESQRIEQEYRQRGRVIGCVLAGALVVAIDVGMIILIAWAVARS